MFRTYTNWVMSFMNDMSENISMVGGSGKGKGKEEMDDKGKDEMDDEHMDLDDFITFDTFGSESKREESEFDDALSEETFGLTRKRTKYVDETVKPKVDNLEERWEHETEILREAGITKDTGDGETIIHKLRLFMEYYDEHHELHPYLQVHYDDISTPITYDTIGDLVENIRMLLNTYNEKYGENYEEFDTVASPSVCIDAGFEVLSVFLYTNDIFQGKTPKDIDNIIIRYMHTEALALCKQAKDAVSISELPTYDNLMYNTYKALQTQISYYKNLSGEDLTLQLYEVIENNKHYFVDEKDIIKICDNYDRLVNARMELQPLSGYSGMLQPETVLYDVNKKEVMTLKNPTYITLGMTHVYNGDKDKDIEKDTLYYMGTDLHSLSGFKGSLPYGTVLYDENRQPMTILRNSTYVNFDTTKIYNEGYSFPKDQLYYIGTHNSVRKN